MRPSFCEEAPVFATLVGPETSAPQIAPLHFVVSGVSASVGRATLVWSGIQVSNGARSIMSLCSALRQIQDSVSGVSQKSLM